MSLKQQPLFADAAALEELILAVDAQADPRAFRDHHFQRDPPQFPDPVREAGRDVHRERHFVFSQQRNGELHDVAIAVIEGHADETPLEAAAHHALMHLVERDEFAPRAPQPLEQALEEFGRHFEQMVRLKAVAPRRPDVMQRQDRADAAHERTHQMMQPAEIERVQAGADDRVLQRGDPIAAFRIPRLLINLRNGLRDVNGLRPFSRMTMAVAPPPATTAPVLARVCRIPLNGGGRAALAGTGKQRRADERLSSASILWPRGNATWVQPRA